MIDTSISAPQVTLSPETPPTPPTVKVWRPLKDANDIVQGWEEIDIPESQAKATILPGGLNGKANWKQPLEV